MIQLQRNWVLTALLAILALWIINRITPPMVSKTVALEVTKNRGGILNIHQARDVETTKQVWVDNLDLHRKHRFLHPKLGNVAGYTDNFFVDVTHTIRVKKAGLYNFTIGSDDGFSFSVNGKKVCEHITDRPYSKQTCPIKLSEGNHLINLSYFQGSGNSGWTVEYAFEGEKPRFFGDDSRWISF